MAQIAFLGSTYQGRSVNIDASRAVNWYMENYTDTTSKAQAAMVGTPGLNLFTLAIGASTSPVRGLTTFNNVMYGVIDNKLYSIASNGTPTLRGVLSTSSGRVLFENNGVASNGVGGNQLMIIDGANGYIYNAVTTVFSTISGGGWPGAPTSVQYLDGYFIVGNSSMSFWVSNLYDGLTWGALATAAVSATPDSIQAIANHKQQLMFIKERTTEVWYNAAIPTSTGSPFQRVSGAVYDFGTTAPFSLANGGNSFFFLCTQRVEDGGEMVGVAEVSGYEPTTVSTPAINYKINQSTVLTSCFGYCYSEQGHIFYVLTNPVDNWTIVYDTTTKLWHERSSLADSFTVVNRHLSNCYTYCYGKHFVGSYNNSNIYEMSQTFLTDNGVPIYSFRTAQTIWDNVNLSNVFVSKLIVDIETGIGTNTPLIQIVTPFPAGWSGTANVLILAEGSITAGAILVGSENPQAYLSWSNDSGHTWSAEHAMPLGAQGEYLTRLIWRRLGHARNRVFKLGIHDGVKKNLIGAYVEVSK